MTAATPRVFVVVLNWNAWADTLECLESLLRLDYPDLAIVLCDNGSTDGSLDRFQAWARGDLCVLPASPAHRQHSVPPAPRPDWHLIRPGGDAPARKLTLIDNGANTGFAAGNNTGLRYALDQGADLVWLLNADTVVTPSALTELVDRLEARPDAGLCGSLLCYYAAPDIIQEAGGCAYHPLLGLARRLAPDRPVGAPHDWRALESRLGYVSAASTLATRAFLTQVGLLSEDYFLYAEEIDWATRGKGRFGLALAERSLVYHKKGLSTGSKTHGEGRSPGSAYYLWRARKRFTRKFHPLGLPGLAAFGLVSAGIETVRGHPALARAILRGLLDRR